MYHLSLPENPHALLSALLTEISCVSVWVPNISFSSAIVVPHVICPAVPCCPPLTPNSCRICATNQPYRPSGAIVRVLLHLFAVHLTSSPAAEQ